MCLFPFYCKKVDAVLPCGRCVECLNTYSTEFAVRCMLEAKEHKDNCFITLTYNNDNCSSELSKRDVQLFFKRLRFSLTSQNITIRYFGCGEYGEKKGRPHYHFIIFGFIPSDLSFLKITKKGEKIYTSDFIAKLWGKGFVSVGNVSFNTAKYCAKYMQKLLDYDGLSKPFILSSRRPGIGGLSSTLDYVKTHCLNTDKVYLNGEFFRVPNYYIKIFEKDTSLASLVLDIRTHRRELVFSRDKSFLSKKIADFYKFAGLNKKKKKWLES